MSKKKKIITYGRKFRDKSGRSVRYVYKNRKKIGIVVLLAADVILPDTEVELNKEKKKVKTRSPGGLFFFMT